jgi:hypothetical protein
MRHIWNNSGGKREPPRMERNEKPRAQAAATCLRAAVAELACWSADGSGRLRR